MFLCGCESVEGTRKLNRSKRILFLWFEVSSLNGPRETPNTRANSRWRHAFACAGPSSYPSLFYRWPRPSRACSDKLPPAGWRARRTAAHYPIGHRAYVPNRASRLCTLCFYYFIFIYYYYLYWFFHTHKHIHTSHAITRARPPHTYPSSLPNVFSSFFSFILSLIIIKSVC